MRSLFNMWSSCSMSFLDTGQSAFLSRILCRPPFRPLNSWHIRCLYRGMDHSGRR